MTKISIIIPVYNAEKTIERCLEAIVTQTFADFEVICINDGSKDKSLELLNKYAQKDSRIRVFDQENLGPAKTRYNAIEKSSGEYLMFCDADDWYEPSMIEDMYSTIVEKNVDLVMCDWKVIDLSDNKKFKKSIKKIDNLKELGFKKLTPDSNYINPALWNKIFKKRLLEEFKILYPQKYEHDDLMFIRKYCLVAKTYYGLNKVLYNYIAGNPESIMGKVFTNNNKKNPFDFIYAWQDLYDFLRTIDISTEYKTYLYNRQFRYFKFYYKYLNKKQKKESFSIIQKFIEKNPELTTFVAFAYIAKAKNFKEFSKIISKKNFEKVSFQEFIFSIKNINNHKVIRILGFKIKVKIF